MNPNEWLNLEPKAKPHEPHVPTVDERIDTLYRLVNAQDARLRMLEDRLYYQAKAWADGDDDD